MTWEEACYSLRSGLSEIDGLFLMWRSWVDFHRDQGYLECGGDEHGEGPKGGCYLA